jgi:heme A synthase
LNREGREGREELKVAGGTTAPKSSIASQKGHCNGSYHHLCPAFALFARFAVTLALPRGRKDRMTRTARTALSLAILALVLWLIWSRINIVIWVPLPWWGLLIMALLVFLALDYLIARIFARRP